jgi:hypothetical protein
MKLFVTQRTDNYCVISVYRLRVNLKISINFLGKEINNAVQHKLTIKEDKVISTFEHISLLS